MTLAVCRAKTAANSRARAVVLIVFNLKRTVGWLLERNIICYDHDIIHDRKHLAFEKIMEKIKPAIVFYDIMIWLIVHVYTTRATAYVLQLYPIQVGTYNLRN